MMYSGRAMNFDFFGTSFDFLWHDAFWQTTSGQGTPGHNKLTLRDRFPWMTKSDAAWLRMALKLYNGFEPTARELRKVAEANDRGLSTGASDGNNTSEQQMRKAEAIYQTCWQCGHPSTQVWWTTLLVPETLMSQRPMCSSACLLEYCSAKTMVAKDRMRAQLAQQNTA